MGNTNFKFIIFAVFALMLIACIDEKESEPEQIFNSVKIGNQIWMTENLNVENFRSGEPIPQAKQKTNGRMPDMHEGQLGAITKMIPPMEPNMGNSTIGMQWTT